MAKKQFTVKHGLAIQADNMAFWKKLLKKKHYAKLEEIVATRNREIKARDGYDVYRGSDISCAVQNLFYTSGKSDTLIPVED